MQKFLLRIIIAIHIFLYRISDGRWGNTIVRLPILLLTTRGKRTGKTRTIPLCYLNDNGKYVIIASYGGSAAHPTWFINLKNDPEATIQIGNQILGVVAAPISGELRARLWKQLIQIAPIYSQYQQRTSREIPLVALSLHAAK